MPYAVLDKLAGLEVFFSFHYLCHFCQ
jgi:hypothetical protein